MNSPKEHLLKQLDDARDHLWAVVDALPPDANINPEWNIRDFFAHIAGWEALVYEAFRDHVAGVGGNFSPYTNVDDFNRQFVEACQSQSAEGAKRECEINRFAIKTFLQSIAAEDYAKPVQFPWGSETVVQFIEGAIKHERDHAAEIVNLAESTPAAPNPLLNP
ncbi:MAG: DinB family protein [Anaerolineae bacterium]